MTVQSSASAKIILLGEHAVVYGQPAIAVPFTSLRAYASAAPSGNEPQIRIVLPNANVQTINLSDNSHADHPFVIATKLLFDKFRVSIPPYCMTLRSEIPIASGLGSGAAITTALLRAWSSVVNMSLSPSQLNELVYEIEKLFHGNPSGVDNTVIVYEQPVYFLRNESIQYFEVGVPFRLLIADTGVMASTKISVADVRKLFEQDAQKYGAIFSSIGDLVESGRTAISKGDLGLLGEMMNRNHAFLQQLSVSSVELECLVEAARSAGAFGAKLSGGGRGGNMIALVDDSISDQVEVSLRRAGARQVYSTVVG